MGGPSLADRQNGGNMAQVQQRSVSGADKAASTDGLKMHYEYPEENDYLRHHYAYYDPTLGVCFLGSCGICCNLIPLQTIPKQFEQIMENVERYGVDAVKFGSHEQYSFPSYPNYLPDHFDRIALTARLFKESCFEPVFFNDGFLGNRSWD